MNWIDIASIVFVCVTMNHLGLVKAIECVLAKELPILNCVKCSTMWCVLFYSVLTTRRILEPIAISFLCSYFAIWLELFEGYIDTLYMKLYEKIYPNTDNDTLTSADFDGDSAGSVS